MKKVVFNIEMSYIEDGQEWVIKKGEELEVLELVDGILENVRVKTSHGHVIDISVDDIWKTKDGTQMFTKVC